MLTNTELAFIIPPGTYSTGVPGKILQESFTSYAHIPDDELVELPFIARREGTGKDYPAVRVETENRETGERRIYGTYISDYEYRYFKVSLKSVDGWLKASFILFREDGTEIPLSYGAQNAYLAGGVTFATHKIRLVSFHSDYSNVENYRILKPEPEPEPVFNVYKAIRKINTNVIDTYKTTRSVSKNFSFNADLVRQVAGGASFKATITRNIPANINKKFKTNRTIQALEDTKPEYNPEEKPNDKPIEKPDTKPESNPNDKQDTKFVSKENLILYTQLLKQEIDEYVKIQIEEALKSKGL